MKRTTTRTAAAVVLAIAAMAATADVPFKIGIAGYTFYKQPLDRALETMAKIDCHYLCHKDFFLPYDASAEGIASYRAKLAAAGVETLGTGPHYASDEASARQQFEFARAFGLKTVVGVPYAVAGEGASRKKVESEAMLDVIERLVREYDIRYAIHNHGPDMPELYPTGEAVMKRIARRDRRIGICLDIGHERRAGLDPAAFIRACPERIYDVHLKNIKIDPVENIAMEGPRGELDIRGVFQALADVGYAGTCHIEYEKDFEDNAMALAESFGYYRGVASCIRAKPAMTPAPPGANTLTPAEAAEGWTLAWDGRTLDGWLAVKGGCKAPPEKGWVVEGGTLSMRPVNGISDGKWFPLPPEDARLGGGGDIVTAKKYRDFAFKFDFRLTENANSGVKYFYDETQNKGTCEEYQILENGHPDSGKGRDGNRLTAALYDIFPARAAAGAMKPAGQWNTGMVVSKGPKVEHWLNGVKVLEYERGTREFKAAVKASKYATWGVDASGGPQDWGEVAEGRILLQDHGDSTVSFCNIKVREL